MNSKEFADKAGVSHVTVKTIIKSCRECLEEYGALQLIGKKNIVALNREQEMFLMLCMRNTPKVREMKIQFVKDLSAMIRELDGTETKIIKLNQ